MKESDRRAEASWEQAEHENVVQQEHKKKRQQLQEEMYPSRRPCHKLFIFVSMIAGFAAFAMGFGQVVGIVFQTVGPVQYVLRIYVMGLCALAILCELEWTSYVRESKILGYWITRGLFYVFIGVLGLEENDTSVTRNTERKGFEISHQYIMIVAWLMIVVGSLYFLLGIFCLQVLLHNYRTDYGERLGRAKEVRRTVESYRDIPETTV